MWGVGVGKSNLLSRLWKNEFRKGENTTVGVEVGEKKFTIDNKVIKSQIWDTAGQAKYRAVSTVYYRGAVSAFLVYDITNRKSFESLDFWLRDIREHASSEVIILIVGNKYDLREKREVSHEEAETYAQKHSLPHIYTSAFDAYNIELAFNVLVKESYSTYMKAFKNSIGQEEQSRKNSKNGAQSAQPNNSSSIFEHFYHFTSNFSTESRRGKVEHEEG
jgi:Ras-related protein Rab-11A